MARHVNHLPGTLEERCLAEAERLEAAARECAPGPEREELLLKARQNKIAAKLDHWVSSPGLKPPT